MVFVTTQCHLAATYSIDLRRDVNSASLHGGNPQTEKFPSKKSGFRRFLEKISQLTSEKFL